MFKKKIRLIFSINKITSYLFLLFAAALYSPISICSITHINSIRYWELPEKTRVVLDLSQHIYFKYFTLKKPDRLVLDLKKSSRNPSLLLPDFSHNSLIRKLRFGQKKEGLRVVFDLKFSTKYKVALLPPNQRYGYRLVIDFYQKNRLFSSSNEPKNTLMPKNLRNIIIVIDPGHGGEDPGSIPYGGGTEKSIVLNISLELERLIKKHRGFDAILTRTGDYYISLRERTKLARKNHADLFVSIHADSFHSKLASGLSVFVLSRRGATSESARWLALSENSSDRIGGEDGISLSDKSDILASVLLDLSMTSTISASTEVGKMILHQAGKISRLHGNKVERAGFVVLKSPDIPSVLIETGFVSNPIESRKLKKTSYQNAIAMNIYKALIQYFYSYTPPFTIVESLKKKKMEKVVLQIRK